MIVVEMMTISVAQSATNMAVIKSKMLNKTTNTPRMSPLGVPDTKAE
jgi:hypothetical protein